MQPVQPPARSPLPGAGSCLLPSSVVWGLAEVIPKQSGVCVLQDAPCREVLWLHSADSSSLMAPVGCWGEVPTPEGSLYIMEVELAERL